MVKQQSFLVLPLPFFSQRIAIINVSLKYAWWLYNVIDFLVEFLQSLKPLYDDRRCKHSSFESCDKF